MVQRLTYRSRHSYATKSNQHRIVKTPGLWEVGLPDHQEESKWPKMSYYWQENSRDPSPETN
ncbi:hypothetical protein G4B88_008364 [Cannabis sativa]|uniref:Uncharacterized protein n=1 Tax=Cannabis sativa TaxID=3483 RepID=A0A7J6G7J1_CANSA|nr:hypothetical protein G4B88_008364 [Cannabis sativa]